MRVEKWRRNYFEESKNVPKKAGNAYSEFPVPGRMEIDIQLPTAVIDLIHRCVRFWIGGGDVADM